LRNHAATFEFIQSETTLDTGILKWHVEILEYGSCIKQKANKGKVIYQITQEGEVVDFMKE
jgi:predicted transcriptional regulator